MTEITPIEAAREFGRDYETIMRYCREGLVPARKYQGHWLIDRDAIAAYAHAHGWLQHMYGITGRPSRVQKAIRRLLTEAAVGDMNARAHLRYAAQVVCEEALGHTFQNDSCTTCEAHDGQAMAHLP